MTSFARTAQSLAIASLIAAVQLVRPAAAQTDEARRSGGSFYAGAHVGYMFGNATATLSDPIGIGSQSATNPYGALFGGVQAGWEYVFPSRLMLGIEADFSFPNYEDASKVLSYRSTATGYASEEYEWIATLRGRLCEQGADFIKRRIGPAAGFELQREFFGHHRCPRREQCGNGVLVRRIKRQHLSRRRFHV